jgi:predicted permease
VIARLRRLLARLRASLTRRRHDEDFASELESHVAMLADEHVRRGRSPEAARRAAIMQVGGLAVMAERHRDARGLPTLESVLQDTRFAARTLRRDAGFTLFAVLIVGLGIGASATVFSVVHALLLRPLPLGHADRLVWLANDVGEGLSSRTVPVNHFVELRDHTRSFADIAAFFAFYGIGDRTLIGHGEPRRVTGVPVTQNFFDVLGVRPLVGRSFSASEVSGRGPQVAILAYPFWQSQFHGDPGIVGKTMNLNDVPVTIVGVMPASFDFATMFAPGVRVDFYGALPLIPAVNARGNTLSMVGRLEPGVTIEAARAELRTLVPRIRQRDPDRLLEIAVRPLQEQVSGNQRTALLVLTGAVGIVMLIVCANVSNLLLSRTATRRREMAIRAALGAGRWRLVRQMLTESVVLSSLGAALGLGLAVSATRALARFDAFNIALLDTVRIDGAVLVFTAIVTALTGLVMTLAPALQGSAAARDALNDGGRGATGGRRQTFTRSALVVSEIAFACVLLVGAGLLIRSLVRVLDQDLGFHPERAAALRVDPGIFFRTRPDRIAYYEEVMRRAREIPGIDAVGVSDALPLGGNRSWSVGDKTVPYTLQSPPPEAYVRIVSDGYLRAMGIGLSRGRDFTADDGPRSTPVIIVNETLARTLWPGQDPIGRMTTYAQGDRTVIGVVRDVRHLGLEKPAGPEIYLPFRQTDDYGAVDLVLRTSLPPERLAASVRSALTPVAPNLPMSDFRTLQQLVDTAVSSRRFVVTLLTGFSVFALLLASLGIYAVISYSVTQRTQELGIRLALGASGRLVQTRILAHTLALAAMGVVAGGLGAWLLARGLSGLLFGVTAADPITFVGMIATLIAVAIVAGYLPARRASRLDLVAALRPR